MIKVTYNITRKLLIRLNFPKTVILLIFFVKIILSRSIKLDKTIRLNNFTINNIFLKSLHMKYDFMTYILQMT